MTDKLTYDVDKEIAWMQQLAKDLSRFRIVYGIMPFDPVFATINFIQAAIYRAEHNE